MQERVSKLTGQVAVLEDLDRGFSRTGIQSFALEGILGELQVCQHVHATLSSCNCCPALADIDVQQRSSMVCTHFYSSSTAYRTGSLDTFKEHQHNPFLTC